MLKNMTPLAVGNVLGGKNLLIFGTINVTMHLKCRHELLQVPTSRGPPEPMAQQGESAADSRVAGRGGRMSTLQDLRACVLQHIHPVGGCVLRWRLIPQGPLDLVLNLQPGGGFKGPSREYGFRGLRSPEVGAWSQDRASGLPFLEPGR